MLDRFLFVLPVQFSFSYRQTEHKSIHALYSLVPILFELNLTKSYEILQNRTKSGEIVRNLTYLEGFFSFRCFERLFEMIMKRCY